MIRRQTLNRKDVFELLLSIQNKAAHTHDIEDKLTFMREMDTIIDRFIYADDPLADIRAARKQRA